MNGVISASPHAGATLKDRPGYVECVGPDSPWSSALTIELPAAPQAPDVIGLRILVDLDVVEGTLGVYAADATGVRSGEERLLGAGRGRMVATLDVETATSLWCRNGDRPSARVRLYGVRVVARRTFDITDIIRDLLRPLLMEPGPLAVAAVAQALSRRDGRVVHPEDIGALTCADDPVPIPFEGLWDDEIGRQVLADTTTLIDLLPTYDPGRMDPRNGYLGREFFATYLRQSTIRVYHCLKQLREAGVRGGSVLDVGSLFGQFALSFRRLGYEVTAVDRYRTYDGALNGYVEYMQREGITVISTTRENETDVLATLGAFDVVLSMAVIEHIPHTPRLFLETLVSHVAPGGSIVLDTPNISRYWNRRRLAAGETIHQSIEKQYCADIPYEGHHREYTLDEMVWMLERVGCQDIRSRYFDYNLLQFTELWPDHLQALLAMTVDPALADTILVSGAVRPPTTAKA